VFVVNPAAARPQFRIARETMSASTAASLSRARLMVERPWRRARLYWHTTGPMTTWLSLSGRKWEAGAAFAVVGRHQRHVAGAEPFEIGLPVIADHRLVLAVLQAHRRPDGQRLLVLVDENDHRRIIVVLGLEAHDHAGAVGRRDHVLSTCYKCMLAIW